MATLANARIYNGVATCIRRAAFGKVHGTSAANGTLELDGIIQNIRLGSVRSIRIGRSVYYGWVVRYEHDMIEQTTTLTLVDWRDVLHDHWVFGAYNMQEADGRIWHLFMHHWEDNIVTPVAKELDQLDFSRLQNTTDWNALQTVAKERLLSGAEILNFISGGPVGFTWVAEPDANTILEKSRPMNMDFQNGSRVSDAVQMVLEACGLQFTIRKPGQLYITMKGFSSNLIVNGILNEAIDPCDWDADSYVVGREISEKGRRVTVVGKRNRHQFTFPCKPDWNTNWTWEFCYGGWVLSGLLNRLGLTRDDKVGDLPERFQDSKHWHESHEYEGAGHVVHKRTRNDMTIQEYLDKVAFRIYVVDFSKAVAEAKYGFPEEINCRTVQFFKHIPTAWLDLHRAAINGEELPSGDGIPTSPPPLTWMDESYLFTPPTYEEITSPYPPSEQMVTDSNMQCVVLATSRKIVNGIRHPFADQRTMIPMNEGFSLDVEHKIVNVKFRERDRRGKLTGKEKNQKQMAYTVRLIFNEARFFENKQLPFTNPKAVKPDYVFVVLSLDGSIYQYTKGDMSNSTRVRAQKVDVGNLHRAEVNDHGVVVLADNLRLELQEGGVTPAVVPAKADDIANKIADQALFHLAINKSGSMTFSRPVGFECDGLIDSVQLELGENEASESIQLTDGWLDGEKRSAPIELGLSAKIKFEGKLVIDRLKQLAKAGRLAAHGRGTSMGPPGLMLQMPGSVFNPAATSKAFSGGAAAQGTGKVRIGRDIVTEDSANGLTVSQVMIYGKLKGLGEVDDT